MPRLPDVVLAAKIEAEKFNATFEYDRCKRHHVAVIGVNGHKRKVFISMTGSDFRIMNAVREDVRRDAILACAPVAGSNNV